MPYRLKNNIILIWKWVKKSGWINKGMIKFSIKNIPLVLLEEGDNVRVKSPSQNIFLASQNIENVILIIEENFTIVDSFYQKRISDSSKTSFNPGDIHNLSLTIVLSYLSMYNSWRLKYKAKKYQDLTFRVEDLDHPTTSDHIFRYFKNNYPEDWELKCSVIMAMELADLKAYYERREQYYNK